MTDRQRPTLADPAAARPVRVAVDAMGGDHAPRVIVEGAVQAAVQQGVLVSLVGPEAVLRPLAIAAAGGASALARAPVDFREAPEVIGMDELPLSAIKRKKQSSILVGLRQLAAGEADAFLSAGNTGAIMAAATLVLRRLPGVERAALAALLPTATGESVLLDVGANVDVRPQHLGQFAVMRSCFLRAVRGVKRPRVALLSIGEEEFKGNDLIRQVHQELKNGPVNFIGNVDGKDVYSGHADVIVTDGFTGNAILKASESLLFNLVKVIRREVEPSLLARAGYLLLRPALRRVRRRVDHDEHGAVPLLGVGRPVFIGHGSSSARSIRSALRVIGAFVVGRVDEAISDQLAQLAAARPAAAPVAGPVVAPAEALAPAGAAAKADAAAPAGAGPAPGDRAGPAPGDRAGPAPGDRAGDLTPGRVGR